jgi:hypothetical protein
MDRKIVERDFGGIVKYSITENVIYVDPCFMLTLKRRRITPEFENEISDILCNDPELSEFFKLNKERLLHTTFLNALNEIPITTVKRVLGLAKQIEDEEQKEDLVITS